MSGSEAALLPVKSSRVMGSIHVCVEDEVLR